MNERAPRPEPLPDESEDSQKRNEEHMEGLVRYMQEIIDDESVEGTPRQKILSIAEQNIEEDFADKEEAPTDFLEWLRNDKDTPDEELAREAAQRWYESAKEKFLDENHAISYTKKGEKIYLHVQDAHELSTGDLMKSIKQSLPELATRMRAKNDLSEVNEVVAASWIVAHRSGKKMMERLGFTIDGPISEEIRQRNFPDDTRPIWTSHMDKDDFLRRYGNQ